KELVARRDIRLRKAREAGVPFVLGTDSNGHNLPFGSALEELIRHRDVLGMTDAKALASGTSEAAEALGAGGRIGRIAPGYGADLLVVRGRPWQDIGVLRPENLVAVVCRGRVVAGEVPQDQAQPDPRPVTLLRDGAPQENGRPVAESLAEEPKRPESTRDDLRESLRGSLQSHL
ncbi:MAG TPA: amidohydrolase family protein, partial [Actinopolymorphaceae bacterium]